MTKQIHKYDIVPVSGNCIPMPDNATILSIQAQRDNICIWALVDVTAPFVMRKFDVFGTGFTIDDTARKYLGTVLVQNGDFVWHVFERL